MAKQSNSFFEDLAGKPVVEPIKKKRGVGYLDERDNELSLLTRGEIENKTFRWVDPAQCRLWERHNRRYDLLSKDRCQDLIDGFRSQGKQEFPAIVRKVEDDPSVQYEVICGARRHWTVTWLNQNNYPEFKFLIEVRAITDEQAFRLSDIENRDKQDISDYERATDYKAALEHYYSSQKEMAQRLEVSEAWLSRYLDLAELPDSIVKAFGSVTEIRTKHGRDLKPHLKDKRTLMFIETKASEISKQQDDRINQGKKRLAGSEVVRKLISSTTPRKSSPRGTLAEYTSKSGKIMLSVNRQGRSGLLLRVVPDSGASKLEVIKACEIALEAFM